MAKPGTYAEFWPHYLRAHSRPATRMVHFAGTAGVLLLAGAAIVTGPWWLLLLVPLVGYGPSWLAHALIERNAPATFSHPVWSLASDFRMLFQWLTGRLEQELIAAGATGQAEPAAPARPKRDRH